MTTISNNLLAEIDGVVAALHPYNNDDDWTEYDSGLACGLDAIRGVIERLSVGGVVSESGKVESLEVVGQR